MNYNGNKILTSIRCYHCNYTLADEQILIRNKKAEGLTQLFNNQLKDLRYCCKAVLLDGHIAELNYYNKTLESSSSLDTSEIKEAKSPAKGKEWYLGKKVKKTKSKEELKKV